jgi:acyl-[acyl carrier protein]--UDP-N-acetylglucosamine O-acyltransferase
LASETPHGAVFYNEDTYRFEGLHLLADASKEWLPFGGVIDIDSDTFIKAESAPGDDDDTLSFFANNPLAPRMTMTESLLSTSTHVKISQTLTVDEAVVLNSTLSVQDPTVLASTLSVGNSVDMANNVRMGSQLSVLAATTMANTLSVADKVFMSSTLSVTGATDVVGATQLGSTLSVSGATDIVSAVQMGSTLSVLDAVYMASTLSVNGATDVVDLVRMGSTLSVKDHTTLTATLSLGAEAYLESNLSVKGVTDIVGRTQILSTLSVTDHTILASTLSVGKEAYLESNLSVKGVTDMLGRVQLASTLSVGGKLHMSNSLSVAGSIKTDSTLTVDDHAQLNSSLSVESGVQIAGLMSVNQNLYVNGATGGTVFTNTIKDATTQNGGGTLTIDVETLHLLGNLDVSGTYNTSDVNTSTLLVEDKKIVLATTEDYDVDTELDTQVDGADTNDHSGLKIAGTPALADLSVDVQALHPKSSMWEKSFLWNINQGMGMLGYLQPDVTNDKVMRDAESYWEVKGGAFHLTANRMLEDPNNPGTEIEGYVKYGFRINANNELEIIKRTSTEDESKRVAKFGITASF